MLVFEDGSLQKGRGFNLITRI